MSILGLAVGDEDRWQDEQAAVVRVATCLATEGGCGFQDCLTSVLGSVSLFAVRTFSSLSRPVSFSSPVAVNNCSTICYALLM